MAGKRKAKTQAKKAPTTKTSKATKAAKVQNKTKKRDAKANNKKDEEDKSQNKEIASSMSNGVLVDHKIPNPGSYEVVCAGGKVLNAHLMYADCVRNNNKFYIIQGLKSGSSYYLWTRWGRVGVDGQVGKLM